MIIDESKVIVSMAQQVVLRAVADDCQCLFDGVDRVLKVAFARVNGSDIQIVFRKPSPIAYATVIFQRRGVVIAGDADFRNETIGAT
jgi:hypothetical protein